MRRKNSLNRESGIDSASPATPQMETLRGAPAGTRLHQQLVRNVLAPWRYGLSWLTASSKMAATGFGVASQISGATLAAVMDYTANWKRFYTDAMIEQWVDNIDSKREIKAGEETSPGGRYYVYMKNELQKSLHKLPEPWRTVAIQYIMNNRHFQNYLRSDEMAKQFEEVDEKIRQAYAKHFKATDPECVADPARLKQKMNAMRWHGLLFDEKYNHKFLAETSTGEIVEVSQNQIARWFPKGAKDFPHVIVTSSHAQGETLADVRSIVHGYAAQALHSGDKRTPLKLKHVDEGVGPGDTIILYACDVEETPWKNGAALLRRVNELKRIGNQRDTQFKYVSPGAVRIAKLMLKCKSEDPSAINTQEKVIDGATKKPTEHSLTGRADAITLRSDAGVISHHFEPMGFSKGGNVISDAGRYSNFLLASHRAGGEELFCMSKDHPICKRSGDYSMSLKNVRNLMRGHAYLADAAVEVALSDWDVERGMVRRAVNNTNDLISMHHNYKGREYRDHRLIVDGTFEHLGHAPDQFLGKKKPQAEGTENPQLTHEMFERGYRLDNPIAERFSFEYFAPNYGKAAIGHVSFKEGADQGIIIIEPSPGTLDSELMKHASVIKDKLGRALSCKVTIEENPDEPGRIRLICARQNFVNNGSHLRHLLSGFAELRKPEVRGLVIAQELDTEINSQIKKTPASSRNIGDPSPTLGRAA